MARTMGKHVRCEMASQIATCYDLADESRSIHLTVSFKCESLSSARDKSLEQRHPVLIMLQMDEKATIGWASVRIEMKKGDACSKCITSVASSQLTPLPVKHVH